MGWSILDADFTPNLVRIARRFTPISPHTLSDRPLMTRADGTIEVRLAEDSGEVQVSCDGVFLADLLSVARAFAAG
jgi:NAD kinase